MWLATSKQLWPIRRSYIHYVMYVNMCTYTHAHTHTYRMCNIMIADGMCSIECTWKMVFIWCDTSICCRRRRRHCRLHHHRMCDKKGWPPTVIGVIHLITATEFIDINYDDAHYRCVLRPPLDQCVHEKQKKIGNVNIGFLCFVFTARPTPKNWPKLKFYKRFGSLLGKRALHCTQPQHVISHFLHGADRV